jgi:transposase
VQAARAASHTKNT